MYCLIVNGLLFQGSGLAQHQVPPFYTLSLLVTYFSYLGKDLAIGSLYTVERGFP